MNLKTPFSLNLTALVIAALLPACSIVSTFRPPVNLAVCPPAAGIALTSNQVVRYYTCLSTLPAADVAKEYHAASLSFSETGGISDRLKLAILLSLPNTEFHSTAAALDLLKSLPEGPEPSPSDLPELARLLGMLLAEQQHTDDNIADLTKALAAEKIHSEFLQNKIDAVKDLEINLIHRDQP
jgi:hypothetical protein